MQPQEPLDSQVSCEPNPVHVVQPTYSDEEWAALAACAFRNEWPSCGSSDVTLDSRFREHPDAWWLVGPDGLIWVGASSVTYSRSVQKRTRKLRKRKLKAKLTAMGVWWINWRYIRKSGKRGLFGLGVRADQWFEKIYRAVLPKEWSARFENKKTRKK